MRGRNRQACLDRAVLTVVARAPVRRLSLYGDGFDDVSSGLYVGLEMTGVGTVSGPPRRSSGGYLGQRS